MTNTSIQDRTPEFLSILAQAKKKQNAAKGPRNSLLSDAQRNEANGTVNGERRARSDFARNAAQIGRGISATMGKLERLAQCTQNVYVLLQGVDVLTDTTVAKRKTLFDDKPVEISELTYIVKQDLASLNSQISSLQQLTQSLHPGGSQPRPADQEGQHNKNVVGEFLKPLQCSQWPLCLQSSRHCS